VCNCEQTGVFLLDYLVRITVVPRRAAIVRSQAPSGRYEPSDGKPPDPLHNWRDTQKENPAMGSTTLLCIDDLPQVLELRKATLESQGYSVKLASNGLDAIRTLEETSVAAVLLEYKLEGMDAEAIACHIKQRFPDLPIILLSAYFEMPERILWLVDEYVMKSELAELLVPIIERAQKLAPRSSEGFERRQAAA
jgi:CheY-like chemotaxis protein